MARIETTLNRSRENRRYLEAKASSYVEMTFVEHSTDHDYQCKNGRRALSRIVGQISWTVG